MFKRFLSQHWRQLTLSLVVSGILLYCIYSMQAQIKSIEAETQVFRDQIKSVEDATEAKIKKINALSAAALKKIEAGEAFDYEQFKRDLDALQ